MPEGDFVRRVARRLDQALGGQVLTYCLLRWPSLGGVDLTGQHLQNVDAYGKHLLMHFAEGTVLRTHLRMDGSYHIEHAQNGRPAANSRAHRWNARAVLANAQWVAIGSRLGMVDLVREHDLGQLIGHLGPDIMADNFDAVAAAQRISAQGSRPIGEVLLDQRVIAGVGTIYLAEGLWAWHTHPQTPAQQVVNPAELLTYIRQILWRSTKARRIGATNNPQPGFETDVHGRQHQPCRRCGNPIAVIPIGHPPNTRPGFYCPTCQSDPNSSYNTSPNG